jgi:adenylosuccinate synthase
MAPHSRGKAVKLSGTAEKIAKDYLKNIAFLIRHPRVMIGDVTTALTKADQNNQPILFEGAQATLLDVAHGIYPFVTSSNPSVGGLVMGSGFRPQSLRVVGVAKAYTTKVGEGPFPSELNDKTGQKLRDVGHEYGTTTGRPRRCGWLDMMVINYGKMINGLDEIALTKLDVLSGLKQIKIVTSYRLGNKKLADFTVNHHILSKVKLNFKTMPGWQEDITAVRTFKDLPKAAQNYVKMIERLSGLPVTMIGVGPNRNQLIINKS